MKIKIPAKTFLIGEYSALYQQASVVLTTTPCFELTVLDKQQQSLINIHPNSPAGRWYHQQKPLNSSLAFNDPYLGLGGLGASSAQFIGVYQAYHRITERLFTTNDLMNDYYHFAYNGTGQKPSGHDVLAQLQQGCVLFDGQKRVSMSWPFNDLDFALLRTGEKLATHEHLATMEEQLVIDDLSYHSQQAVTAFTSKNSELLIKNINAFNDELLKQNLTASHTQEILNELKQQPNILASKGCGAMGADIIVVLYEKQQQAQLLQYFDQNQLNCVATTNDLHR